MKEWRSISKAIKLKKGERGEAVDSHSLSRLKNEELGVSIFIGTGVDDPLVSLNLVGGHLSMTQELVPPCSFVPRPVMPGLLPQT